MLHPIKANCLYHKPHFASYSGYSFGSPVYAKRSHILKRVFTVYQKMRAKAVRRGIMNDSWAKQALWPACLLVASLASSSNLWDGGGSKLNTELDGTNAGEGKDGASEGGKTSSVDDKGSSSAIAANGEPNADTNASERMPSVGSRLFMRSRRSTRCVIKGQMKFVPTWNAILCICSPLCAQISLWLLYNVRVYAAI